MTGRILWTYDTVRVFRTVNHVFGMGGSMDGGGAVVSNGMLYTNSGYRALGVPLTEMSGNVVLAFGLS